jgi:hypothetical protein
MMTGYLGVQKSYWCRHRLSENMAEMVGGTECPALPQDHIRKGLGMEVAGLAAVFLGRPFSQVIENS